MRQVQIFLVLTDPLLLEEQIQLLFPRHRGALTFGNTLASLINAGKELLLADKAVIFSYWHNLEVACAGGQDYALPTGCQSKILALICSEIAYAYNSHNYIFSANIMNTILVSKLLCIILVVSCSVMSKIKEWNKYRICKNPQVAFINIR